MANAIARSIVDVRDEEILGFLEFHTITDLRIHKKELGDLFDQHGIDKKKFLPDKIHAHDAFRRASKEIESRVTIQFGNRKDQPAKLLVRDVKTDENMVIRHLVREVLNDNDERLEYNTVGRLILDRKTETVSTDHQLAYLSEYPYDQLLTTARTLYNEWLNYHTKDTVNNIARKMINAMNRVSILPNGKATFLPRSQRVLLESFTGMVKDLAPFHMDSSKTSVVEIIPVIDTIEQRDMISRRAESQLREEADVLLVDFHDLLREDTLGVRQVKTYAERFAGLRERLLEYEDVVHVKMDVLHQQLKDAMSRVQLKQEELKK